MQYVSSFHLTANPHRWPWPSPWSPGGYHLQDHPGRKQSYRCSMRAAQHLWKLLQVTIIIFTIIFTKINLDFQLYGLHFRY